MSFSESPVFSPAGYDGAMIYPTRIVRAAQTLTLAFTAAFVAPLAFAQNTELEQVNNAYQALDRRPELRSDLVLLPLLAKLDAGPDILADPMSVCEIPADSSQWQALESWAMGKPQRDALAALDKVTSVQTWRDAYGFGQRYGTEGIDFEILRAGLYTDLGDPPMLSAARFQCLPALSKLMSLAHIEATRLLAQDKPAEAGKIIISVVYFGRQMVDRIFAQEAGWGYDTMALGLERLRDILYQDRVGKKLLSDAELREMLGRLNIEDDPTAYVSVERAKFPDGNATAGRQLLSLVYDGSGTMNADILARNMGRLVISNHPLRIFSEGAYWREQARTIANKKESLAAVDASENDWERRWGLKIWDRHFNAAWAFERLDPQKDSIVIAGVGDRGQIFGKRNRVRVELGGTRVCIALVGAWRSRELPPPVITAIRPSWIVDIDSDPYNWTDRELFSKPPFKYKPARKREDELSIAIVNHFGPNFEAKIPPEFFVLYSLGSDATDQGCQRAQNTTELVQGADYLLWPPVLSLSREYKKSVGLLK